MTHPYRKNISMLALFISLLVPTACASEPGSLPTGGTGGGGGVGTGQIGGGGGGGGTAEPTPPSTDADSVPRPCTPALTVPAPADGLIATFDPASPFNIVGGGLLAYPVGSDSAPSFDISDGGLRITVERPKMASPQYIGVVLSADGHCIDATEFGGVQFSLSGTISGCSLQYFAGDDLHQDRSSGAPVAAGPPGSYQPRVEFLPSQVSLTAQPVSIRFSGQYAGNPATPLDRSRLILIGWELLVAPDTSGTPGSCVADLRIDDVRFYRTDEHHTDPLEDCSHADAGVACASSHCTDTETCCLDAYAGTAACIDGRAFCGTSRSTGIPASCDEQTDCPPGQSCCLHVGAGYGSILCMPEGECPGDSPFVTNRLLCESPSQRRACPPDETCVAIGGAAPPGWSYCRR